MPAVEKMPDVPTPLILRDWKQVARDMDAFVYDFSKKGQYLPVPWWDKSRVNYPMDVIAVPAYIGSAYQDENSNAYDAITCFGAVLGGTIVGINKADQNGLNHVEMLNAYFRSEDGTDVPLNNVRTETGQTFWYELFPGVLYGQVYDHYRDTPEMKKNFIRTAERWYEAVIGLGANLETGAIPDFDWTAYNLKTGEPLDNKLWKEPDAAAVVAWIEYMAYVHTGDTNFLNAAQWSLEFLNQRKVNPYYECLLPYGAYAAARMNAELGTSHQTEKLVNWCFDGDNPRQWGIVTEDWGDRKFAGLTGSVYKNHEYVFAMNTFTTAGILLPIVRYDERFADALGKWMLNVAINSRYFYPDAWAPEDQSCWEWADKYDPQFCLAYEGVRKEGWARTYAVRDVATAYGTVQGTWEDSRYNNNKRQKLNISPSGKFEHIWEIEYVSGLNHTLILSDGGASENSEMTVWISTRPNSGWKELFAFVPGNSSQKPHYKQIGSDYKENIFVKITGKGTAGSSVEIKDLFIQTKLDKAPYAMGDPTMHGWGSVDLGIYGSVFVGMLGAVVEPTNEDGILRLDCRVTESFIAPSYPTFLYYNPYKEAKKVSVVLPETATDVYDTISNQFVAKDVSGRVDLQLKPKSSMVLVFCPAGGSLSYDGRKTLLNDVVIDYNNERKK